MELLELARDVGLQPKRVASTKGGEYSSACPKCGGDDRFRIWPGKGRWWCRGCDKSGDIITFLMEFKGMSFKEAAAAAGKELTGYKLKEPGSRFVKERQPICADATTTRLPAINKSWQTKALAFSAWAFMQLLEYKEQLAYLQGRGINHDTVRAFNLGYNPREYYRVRSSWGMPDKDENGVPARKLYIPQGIVIPSFNNSTTMSELQRVRIRRGGDVKARYYIVPGSLTSPMELSRGNYNLPWIVVEAELDGLLIFQEAGDLVNVLATGSTAIKPTVSQTAALRAAPLILVAHDYDSSGLKASNWWTVQFSQVERYPVPAGKDPGEAYRAGISIRDWVLAGLPAAVVRAINEKSIGQSGLEKQCEEGEKVNRLKGEEKTPEGNDPVEELHHLLKISRAEINKDSGHYGFNVGKDVPAHVSRRISQLMFYNEQVVEHLDRHPDKKIDWKNFYKNRNNT